MFEMAAAPQSISRTTGDPSLLNFAEKLQYEGYVRSREPSTTLADLFEVLVRRHIDVPIAGEPCEDARRQPGYPPYDELEFEMVRFDGGDVNARIWVRIREVQQSLNLVEQIVRRMPAGSIKVEPGGEGRNAEGMALVEGFRGDVLACHIDDGRIATCCLRDPSWFHWPLLEAVIEGNIVADFPLCALMRRILLESLIRRRSPRRRPIGQRGAERPGLEPRSRRTAPARP